LRNEDADLNIYRYKNYRPDIKKGVFIAPGAVVLGRIKIGMNSSIWFNVTARADVHYINIGKESNIQDNSILHVTNGEYPLNIGNRVTVGHSAALHGCTIKDNTLIGMRAIILDGAEINEFSIVAAGTLILENKKFPPGVLIAGFPAKIKRELKKDEKQNILKYSKNYIEYKNIYLNQANFERIIKDGSEKSR